MEHRRRYRDQAELYLIFPFGFLTLRAMPVLLESPHTTRSSEREIIFYDNNHLSQSTKVSVNTVSKLFKLPFYLETLTSRSLKIFVVFYMNVLACDIVLARNLKVKLETKFRKQKLTRPR